jgi:ubiquinone/menaquinone biosynthesis C-methylase UbiE
MTNRWNRFIYRLWAPVYDLFFAHRGFAKARRRALSRLDVRPGERVILPGVGTGADLPNLPAGAVAVGVDLSPATLAQAQRKLARVSATVWLVQGDVQQMPLASGVFDAAVLNLILSVAPDGHACVLETRRLLRRDGRCVIFDKFLPAGTASPSLRRRLMSRLAMLVGTDLNRRLEVLLAGSGWVVVWEQPALFGGVYRVFALGQEEG